MRYHYQKPAEYTSMYGELYLCEHPVYSACTLFRVGKRGLALIQQRFDEKTKETWWGEIDPWLTDPIYLHTRFKDYFDEHSGYGRRGLYPTVTVRQIMWALKMKPMPKKRWETVFDRTGV